MNFVPVGHELETAARAARTARAVPAPSAPSSAPWEREGAGLSPPDAPEARAAATRWAARGDADARAAAAARAERRAARAARKEAAQIAAAEKLAATAKRLFWVGLAALPFVWLVNVMYFWEELREDKGTPVDDGVIDESTGGESNSEPVDEDQRQRDIAIKKRALCLPALQ
jgi:Presenilin enhancer-2 subunit of gamma secretase